MFWQQFKIDLILAEQFTESHSIWIYVSFNAHDIMWEKKRAAGLI